MRLRKLAGAFAALMLALGATAVALPAASATSIDGQAAGRLHTLINEYRVQHALKPLAWNDGIASVSQSWTLQSAQTANVHGAGTFLHNPNFSANYPAGAESWSENIAWNMSVDQAFNWWINSTPHRANMLRAADTDLGIGVVQLTEGPNKGVYLATVNFGQYADTVVPSLPASPPAETTPTETPAPKPEPTVPAEPEPTEPTVETTPVEEPSAQPSAPAPEPAPSTPPAENVPETTPTEAPAEPSTPDQPAAPSETPPAPVTDPTGPVEPVTPAPEEPSQEPEPVETTVPETPEPEATESPIAVEPEADEIPIAVEPAVDQSAAATATGERVELQSSDPVVLTPEARGSFETRTIGSSLTVTGLTPGHEYQVFLHSTPVKAGVFTVDANGMLRIEIPAGLEAGDHRVALYESNGALAGWQAFTVQAEVNMLGVATAAGPGAPAELASTGFSAGQAMLAGTGAALIIAGAAALMFLRGRRSEMA